MTQTTRDPAPNCLRCGQGLKLEGALTLILCPQCQWVNVFGDTLPDGIPSELLFSLKNDPPQHAFPAPFQNLHVRALYPRLGEKQRATFTLIFMKGRRALTKQDRNRLHNFLHWGRDDKYRKQAAEFDGKAELYEFLRNTS